jgi:hypothetical protein
MNAPSIRRAIARRLSTVTSIAVVAALVVAVAPFALADPIPETSSSTVALSELIAAASEAGVRITSRQDMTQGRAVSLKFAKAVDSAESQSSRIATLQAALRLHGMTLVDVPSGTAGVTAYAVVQWADARQYVAPVITDHELDDAYLAANGSTFVNVVIALRSADASEVERALRVTMPSGGTGTITSVPSTNTLLVWDYADNAARIATLARKLDQVTADVVVVSVELKHARADLILDTIGRLKNEASRGRSFNRVTDNAVAAVTDSRTGNIVVRGPRERVDEMIAMIRELDTPAEIDPAREREVEHNRLMRDAQRARELANMEIERLRAEAQLRIERERAANPGTSAGTKKD